MPLVTTLATPPFSLQNVLQIGKNVVEMSSIVLHFHHILVAVLMSSNEALQRQLAERTTADEQVTVDRVAEVAEVAEDSNYDNPRAADKREGDITLYRLYTPSWGGFAPPDPPESFFVKKRSVNHDETY